LAVATFDVAAFDVAAFDVAAFDVVPPSEVAAAAWFTPAAPMSVPPNQAERPMS
jgi:hypothetical protein